MAAVSHYTRQRGFTLVELLIVVIILAILAAIVVPQFNNTTTDAKEAAMDANLATLRSAIELYRVQHGGDYPGKNVASGASCPNSGTAGTGAANSAAALADQLTMYTNAAGLACSTTNAEFRFGPYLRKGIPAEPFNNSAAVVMQTTGAALTASAATGGYKYDTVSGQIIVNDNTPDLKGNARSTH